MKAYLCLKVISQLQLQYIIMYFLIISDQKHKACSLFFLLVMLSCVHTDDNGTLWMYVLETWHFVTSRRCSQLTKSLCYYSHNTLTFPLQVDFSKNSHLRQYSINRLVCSFRTFNIDYFNAAGVFPRLLSPSTLLQSMGGSTGPQMTKIDRRKKRKL